MLPMNQTTRNTSNSSLTVTDSPSPLLRGEGRGEGSISGSWSQCAISGSLRLSMDVLKTYCHKAIQRGAAGGDPFSRFEHFVPLRGNLVSYQVHDLASYP